MKKVAATWEDDDGQLLRSCPGKHVGQRDHVVLFTVDDNRIGRHMFNRKAIHRGSDQHHAFRGDRVGHTRLHERAERESGKHDRQIAKLARAECERGKRIVGLANAVGKFAALAKR